MKPTGPGQSPLLMLNVIDLLQREGLEYVVVGALAAAVHGVIRASADADVLVSSGVNKLASLAQILEKKGLTTELRRGDLDDPLPALLTISDEYDNCVDLLGGLRGLDPAALSRAVTVPFTVQSPVEPPNGSPPSGRPLSGRHRDCSPVIGGPLIQLKELDLRCRAFAEPITVLRLHRRERVDRAFLVLDAAAPARRLGSWPPPVRPRR